MKKASVVFLSVLIAALVMGCASKPKPVEASQAAEPAAVPQASERKVPGFYPEAVRNAVKDAPKDVLVGIGTAKQATLSQSRTIAATRARAEISRQMNSIVKDMTEDYQAGSELDPSAALSFQENITVTLSRAELVGSSVVAEDQAADGTWWSVVMLSKSDVVNQINQATSAARLAVPAMAAFNAEAQMDEAFDRINSEEARALDN